MIVDADKAVLAIIANLHKEIGSDEVVEDAIRQTDLTDCRVEVGEDNDPEWNSLHCTCGASGVAVMAHEPHCAVILIESLSAQVAEAKRDCQMWFESSTKLMAQVAELKKALLEAADALYNPFEPNNQSRAYKKAIDAAKESGNE